MFEAHIALGIQCNICFDEFREDNVRRTPRIRSLSLLCSLRACLNVQTADVPVLCCAVLCASSG